MSAVDDFLSHEFEKNAQILGPAGEAVASRAGGNILSGVGRGAVETLRSPEVGSEITKGLLAAAGLSLGAATLGGAGKIVGKLWDMAADSISKARGFNEMVKAHPDISSMDRAKAHQLYSTLHNFNPEMARDPYIAGGWVKRTAELDYVDPHTIQALVHARPQQDMRTAIERGMPMVAAGQQAQQLMQQRTLAEKERTQREQFQAENYGQRERQFGVQQALRERQEISQEQRARTQEKQWGMQFGLQQAQARATARERALTNSLGYQRERARETAIGNLQAATTQYASAANRIAAEQAGRLELERARAAADPRMKNLLFAAQENRILGTGGANVDIGGAFPDELASLQGQKKP